MNYLQTTLTQTLKLFLGNVIDNKAFIPYRYAIPDTFSCRIKSILETLLIGKNILSFDVQYSKNKDTDEIEYHIMTNSLVIDALLDERIMQGYRFDFDSRLIINYLLVDKEGYSVVDPDFPALQNKDFTIPFSLFLASQKERDSYFEKNKKDIGSFKSYTDLLANRVQNTIVVVTFFD